MSERPYHGGARFERGDTLMARITGCIEHGKGAFVDFVDTPAAAGSTEFLVLRPRPPLTSEAVFFLSRTGKVRDYAIASMTGSSGRQRVSVEGLSRLQLAIPPNRDSWADLALLMRTSLERTRAIWQESKTLAAIRDTLLPKLISGEIRVPDTDDLEEVIGPAAEELTAGRKGSGPARTRSSSNRLSTGCSEAGWTSSTARLHGPSPEPGPERRHGRTWS